METPTTMDDFSSGVRMAYEYLCKYIIGILTAQTAASLVPYAKNQSALLSMDQTFHWPCSQRNSAGEAVPRPWHVEDINAFLFESDSNSLPLPAEQNTTLKTDWHNAFLLFCWLQQHMPPVYKDWRKTKSKVGRHAIQFARMRERKGKIEKTK